MASRKAQLNIPVDTSVLWVVTALGKVDHRNRKGALRDVENYCRGGSLGGEVNAGGDGEDRSRSTLR